MRLICKNLGRLNLVLFIASVVILENCQNVHGHGRLMEPPNRSSLFRFPEFNQYEPEKNWNDMELWCGGLTVQYEQNGGKCGPCGDNYKDKRPRVNENGGIYGRGIIVRNYKPGQIIKMDVELTQYHKGHFEFSLCPLANGLELEDEECFEKYPLALADGSGFRYRLPRNESGWFNTTVKLPPNLSSAHSVIRWHYRTGNRWDWMDNNHGTGGLGHGDQEIFRGCADVSIGDHKPNTPRPPSSNSSSTTTTSTTTIRPTATTSRSTTTTRPTTTTRRPGSPLPPRPGPPSAPSAKPPSKAPIPIQQPPRPTSTTSTTTTSSPSTSSSSTTTTTTSTPSSSTPQSQPQQAPPRHPMMRPPVREAPKNKQYYLF